MVSFRSVGHPTLEALQGHASPSLIGINDESGVALYVVVAPVQIKEDDKEQFIQEMIEDARGSVTA